MTNIMFENLNISLFLFKLKKSKVNIIFMLIIASLFIAIIFFVLFIRSVKTGQYDDLYTPSVRMLFDDELVKDNNSENKITKS
jgi:cbb3-type cytochrome oxidase maturation protein